MAETPAPNADVPVPEKPAPPAVIVIFGASGDLTKRKLIPALFNSYRKGGLPQKVHIVGFARRPWSRDEFRAIASK